MIRISLVSFVTYLALEGTYCNLLQDLRNQPQNDLSVLPYTVSQYHACQRSSKVKKVRNPLNQEWTTWLTYYRIKKGKINEFYFPLHTLTHNCRNRISKMIIKFCHKIVKIQNFLGSKYPFISFRIYLYCQSNARPPIFLIKPQLKFHINEKITNFSVNR